MHSTMGTEENLAIDDSDLGKHLDDILSIGFLGSGG